MAVELMMGYGKDSFTAARMEESAVEEAASAGLQSMEKLIRMLSQRQKPQQLVELDCKAVADAAVTKFKKVISLLDRTRTGHARFRRAPVMSPNTLQQQKPLGSESTRLQVHSTLNQTLDDGDKQNSGSKIYCPTPIQRLPPLPHQNHNHPHHHHNTLPKNNGSILERKESTATINFSTSSPPISAATSFLSSLTGETDSVQPSLSSGFQITHVSQVSSVGGRPPLSSSSLKRKCSSMDDGTAAKCGGASSSGRCHCSKRRSVR